MPRTQVSVIKRQREQAKRERQQLKAERRAERKRSKDSGEPEFGEVVAESSIAE